MSGRFAYARRMTPEEETIETRIGHDNPHDSISDEQETYVAFYARVSKEEENMLRSMKNQKEMFGDWLKTNSNWVLYDTYLDEGITGLNTKKRYGFRRLLEDAKRGKFKIVIIKSISRFGRNMTDTNAALDLLMGLGVRVIFKEDSIDSNNASDVQKFGLFSWLAEIESRKISERINTTFDKMKKQGYYFGSKAPFGYYKKEGKLYINTEEAKIVRGIYDKFQSTQNYNEVIRYLDDMGVSPYLADEWSSTQVKRILSNPCYTGDTYNNQSKTVDVKQRVRETNNFDQWNYFPDTHEVIISKKVFEKVQIIMEEKREHHNKTHRPSTKHLFSNLVECGRCGSTYARRSKSDRPTAWNCSAYEEYGTKKCSSVRVRESDLIEIVRSFFNYIANNKPELVRLADKAKSDMESNENVLKRQLEQLQSEKDSNAKKMKKLLDLYAEDLITKQEYVERTKPYNDEINILTQNISDIQKQLASFENIDLTLKKTIETIDNMCDPNNWSNELLKETLHKIVVSGKDAGEDRIDIYLKLQKATAMKEMYLNEDPHSGRCARSCRQA